MRKDLKSLRVYERRILMGYVERLLELLNSDCCDYDMCRQMIAEIGGCTQIIEDKYGVKTTPLHEAIECGHYAFALELIKEPSANLDVEPCGSGPIMWDLQYLWSDTDEEQRRESESKLRLMRALISAGANPNPKVESEELLYYIRHKISESEVIYPEKIHLWQMEHIIEAHTYDNMERFVKKMNEQEIDYIMLSNWGFSLIDDNMCDCDHAIVVFKDGERMSLSSYMVGDDEWDFYSVSIKNEQEYGTKYHIITPQTEAIKFLSLYSDEFCSNSHWLDLSIDDAILRIHADAPNITVGIVGLVENDYHYRKRKKLFETEE